MEHDDWQNEHFKNRRIGHGRKGKGKGSAKGGVFDPRRSYGVYRLHCPALAELPANIPAPRSRSKTDGATLEIHGPVESRDDALMCSMEMPGVMSGVAVLAGSRKALSSVVQDLEHPEPEEELEGDDDDGEEEAASDASKGSDEDEDSHEEEPEPKSSIELADEKERRRYAAFEKNSFRSPKFWMRWRALIPAVHSQDTQVPGAEAEAGVDPSFARDHIPSQSIEANGGYLVFSGNDCASFNGTISSAALDWRNVKLSGTKVVSKARQSPRGWTDVAVTEA